MHMHVHIVADVSADVDVRLHVQDVHVLPI